MLRQTGFPSSASEGNNPFQKADGLGLFWYLDCRKGSPLPIEVQTICSTSCSTCEEGKQIKQRWKGSICSLPIAKKSTELASKEEMDKSSWMISRRWRNQAG